MRSPSDVRSVGKQVCYLTGALLRTLAGRRVFTRLGQRYLSNMEACLNSRNLTTIDAEYEKAIKALNKLQSNAETLRCSTKSNAKQSKLEDIIKYLHRSGLDEKDLSKLSVIHVSGTKGKGSTCALTESILRSHGFITGLFSSPHLVSVTERIRINGQPISKSKFTQSFWRILKRLEESREHATDLPPYFKFLTILGFHIFLEEKVDVLVLEVGIGGELDCTNVVRNTKTVGITSLGLEHTNLLGITLESIAWQKAGIIKENSNVYTTVTQPECLSIIRKRAAEKNATLHIVPKFDEYIHINETTSSQLKTLSYIMQLNASLAIQLAYDWLREHHILYSNIKPNATEITTLNIIEGLTNCNLMGRCQIVNFGNCKIHLDGAHTVESICLCSDWFAKMTEKSEKPKVLIFNVTGERDSRKLLNILRQKNNYDLACFVPNISSSRTSGIDNITVQSKMAQMQGVRLHAHNWQTLCRQTSDPDNGQVYGSILDSFHYIRQKFKNVSEVNILVTGSLHLVGSALLALDELKR